MKYQSSETLGSKDIAFRESEFVANIHSNPLKETVLIDKQDAGSHCSIRNFDFTEQILFLKIETITIEEVNRVKASSLDILDSKLL